jgi:Putative threonine efflux protein
MHLYNWLTVVTVGFLAVIIPGPNMAVVVRNSLSHTRFSGVYTAAGLALGNLVHVAYCLVGIGVLISKSIVVFNLIRLAGAFYLIYLGIKALRSRPGAPGEESRARLPFGTIAALRSGFLTDLLNPKATLFFLALFTQVIDQGTSLVAQLGYALTIVTLEFVCLAFLALTISRQSVRQRLQAVNGQLERITGAVFIALGLKVIAEK